MRFRCITLAFSLAVLLAACAPTPGLDLDVAADTVTLARGSVGDVSVTITRSGGFDGSVTVTLESAPSGVSANPLTLAGGETSGSLALTATDTAPLGDAEITVHASGAGVEAEDTFTLTVTEAPGTQTVVADGFNGPMGTLVDDSGDVWVIDSGTGGDTEVAPGVTYGDTARVVRVSSDGTQAVVAVLPSIGTPEGNAGGGRLARLDGALYATSAEALGSGSETFPFFTGVVRIDGSTVVEVADTWAFEASENPDGLPASEESDGVHSHPYGLAAGADGSLWVADAGGNDLLRVDPATGDITLVAVFDQVTIPSPDGPMTLQAVPTGVTTGESGNAYVTFFHGGVAEVTPAGVKSAYAEDVILATDIQRGPDGELYVVQIADFDFGPGSGAVVRVAEGGGSEVVVDGLTFPSSIAFASNGDAYVTTNVLGAPGSGALVKIAGLTSLGPTGE